MQIVNMNTNLSCDIGSILQLGHVDAEFYIEGEESK